MKAPNAKKMKFALIATYPELSRILTDFCSEANVELENIFASFEDAAKAAAEASLRVDAIFTRGATGEYVRKAASVPVIQIPISPFDLVNSVAKLPHRTKELAFFTYNRIIYGVRDIEKIFHKKIYEYTFETREDIVAGIEDMKAKGLRTLIGGNVAVDIARAQNLEGIEITNGKQTIYRSLREAISLVETQRMEAAKAIRLRAAFNAIKEGLIVTDSDDNIAICNNAAGKLFHINSGEVIGKDIKTILKWMGTGDTFEADGSENYLKEIDNTTINVQHLPIEFENKLIGHVSTFEDITKIQNLEGQIRKKLNEKGFKAKRTFDDILSNSKNMSELKGIAQMYAQTNSAVLIEGESGTGKEIFAQSIHNASNCANGPFVAVNCAAIPEQLLESELFGYDAGAFTGARKDGKPGLFELAHNGTMFLDEIGEISKSLQARLLRVLQEREIMRVGGDKVIPINVRILSATNKNLEQKVKDGEFREDLYYRLNVFHIKIPPLRHRREDIEGLCYNLMNRLGIFLDESGQKLFQAEVLPKFKAYNWPGNVRELENMIERVTLLLKDGQTESLRQILKSMETTDALQAKDMIRIPYNGNESLNDVVSSMEAEIIKKVLEDCGGNQDSAAKKLGISRTTLWRKYQK